MAENNTVTKAQQAEAELRSDLESTLVVIRTLEPCCETVKQLIGVLEFALVNDGQLRFLWSKFVQKT
jgi:hypothetical protein